jgi:histone H3/H4
MAGGTLQVRGRKFRVIPEAEFRALRRQAKAGLAAQKRLARKAGKSQWEGKSIKEMNDWMIEHWDEVMEKAKANTKRLTGREVL